jgi:transposase
MPTTTTHIGVDIAKQNFVADLAGRAVTFAQTPPGFALFIKRLPPGATVVCEATGGCERGVAQGVVARQVAGAGDLEGDQKEQRAAEERDEPSRKFVH